ncbi:FHA domain-containing protein [Spirosoma sp. 209]|uniref:FHA domain-containing protein n=1 Tax=Spirosoma sp. 209 TaxID=1955701 RepID=UPI00098D3901|nr:FHA domain-containing protein [Spirosoma sp. 209]
MTGFKTTLITCHQCARRIMVRAADAERGSIICSHLGCGAINTLQTTFQYDERLVQGLPGFGKLVCQRDPTQVYPLQFGDNVIGTANTCTVQVERFMHSGQCFVSRRHCTLTVTFDPWAGQLRYLLQDGVADPQQPDTRQYSLNGTQLNQVPIRKTELIDVADQALITLGGVDQFRLFHFSIPQPMLDTYKIELAFNPDRTQ